MNHPPPTSHPQFYKRTTSRDRRTTCCAAPASSARCCSLLSLSLPPLSFSPLSDFYGVGVRDREDAGQERHDELRVRRVRHGGGVRHEAGAASGVLWLRGNGHILGCNGQDNGSLTRREWRRTKGMGGEIHGKHCYLFLFFEFVQASVLAWAGFSKEFWLFLRMQWFVLGSPFLCDAAGAAVFRCSRCCLCVCVVCAFSINVMICWRMYRLGRPPPPHPTLFWGKLVFFRVTDI